MKEDLRLSHCTFNTVWCTRARAHIHTHTHTTEHVYTRALKSKGTQTEVLPQGSPLSTCWKGDSSTMMSALHTLHPVVHTHTHTHSNNTHTHLHWQQRWLEGGLLAMTNQLTVTRDDSRSISAIFPSLPNTSSSSSSSSSLHVSVFTSTTSFQLHLACLPH